MTPFRPPDGGANEADTDSDWEYFGANDPYWAVVTFDQFHRPNLNEDTRREFFEMGEAHIAHVFEVIHTHLDRQFAPRKALDFGCGVGRLVIPLAARCDSVFGVDVSESMLREARSNCDQRDLRNVTLVRSDDNLSAVSERFDLIHTFIVLQHIPCDRGSRIFGRLVELLDDGGVGVFHLTYSKQNLGAENICTVWPAPTRDGLRHHLAGLRRAAKRRLGELRPRLWASRKGAGAAPIPTHPPYMQMNSYALNHLFHILQKGGVRATHVEFTDHGVFGVVLYFKKAEGAPYQL